MPARVSLKETLEAATREGVYDEESVVTLKRLAPELAAEVLELRERNREVMALVLDMGEQLQSMRHDYLRNMPRCECLSCMAIRPLLARLSRLGAGDSNQIEKEQPDG